MRIFVRKIIAVAAACALLVPGQVLAWGREGHSMIAYTAFMILKAERPQAAAKLDAALASIYQSDILATTGNDKTGKAVECHARNIDELASWADCVRYITSYSATGAYHFDDIPNCVNVPPPPPLGSYCRNGACASEALPKFVATLSDPHADARHRAEALAWVIHIVGDLHQPLHTTDNADAGGNAIQISEAPNAIPGLPKRPAINLHSLWDGDLVFAAIGTNGPQAAANLMALAHANAQRWSSTDPLVWAEESHRIAQAAYRSLSHPPACATAHGYQAANGGVIDARYVAQFVQPVREQLAKASLRLSILLEHAFA